MIYGYKITDIAENAPYLEEQYFINEIFPQFKSDINLNTASKHAYFGNPRIRCALPIFHNTKSKTVATFELSIVSMCDGVIEFLIIAKNVVTGDRYLFRIDERFLGKEICDAIENGDYNNDNFER